MNYSEIVADKRLDGSLRNWVNDDKVPAELIVQMSETWLEARLRVVDMHKREEITVPAGTSEITLSEFVPDFLDPITAYIRGYGELAYWDESQIDHFRGAEADGTLSEGCPSIFSTLGRRTLYFDCITDQDYMLVLTYYSRPDRLGPNNDTNLYTDAYPHILHYVLLGFAYQHLKDEARSAAFFQLAVAELEQIYDTDDLARRGQVFDIRLQRTR